MATSHSLFGFASSLPLKTPISDLFLNSSQFNQFPAKSLVSVSRRFAESQVNSNSLYKKRNGVSTSSVVAIDSTETAIITEDKDAVEASEQNIVLPTNGSCERLLRIRHTVQSCCCRPLFLMTFFVFLLCILEFISVWSRLSSKAGNARYSEPENVTASVTLT